MKAINRKVNKWKVEKTVRSYLRAILSKLSQSEIHLWPSSCLGFPDGCGCLFTAHTCGCISRPHLPLLGWWHCLIWLSSPLVLTWDGLQKQTASRRSLNTPSHTTCLLLPCLPAPIRPSSLPRRRKCLFSLVEETRRETRKRVCGMWGGLLSSQTGRERPAHLSASSSWTCCHEKKMLLSGTVMGAQTQRQQQEPAGEQAGAKSWNTPAPPTPGHRITFSNQVLGIRLVASNLLGLRPEFPGLPPPLGSFPSSSPPEAC